MREEQLQIPITPKHFVIEKRLWFDRRSQQTNEPMAVFTLELRLAGSCEFEQFSNDAFRDWFVAVLRDKTAQAELLKKSTLAFLSCLSPGQKRGTRSHKLQKFTLISVT
ncbi:hypothetical protein MTO96_015164 [Rhipicephalus appendiculatus]